MRFRRAAAVLLVATMAGSGGCVGDNRRPPPLDGSDAGMDDRSAIDDDGDGYSELTGDCDDTDAFVYPGAPEIIGDGSDNNCNGLTDEGPELIDDDGDGYTEMSGDCDDANANIFPGAAEDGGAGTQAGNGIDDNCDGIVDNMLPSYDDDGDGFTELEGDCDDAEEFVNPNAAEETTDMVDNDCDGMVDEVTLCDTGTLGTTLFPEAMEICQNVVSLSSEGNPSCRAVVNALGPFTNLDTDPAVMDSAMVELCSGVIGAIGNQQPGEDHFITGVPDPDGSVASVNDLCGFTLVLDVPSNANSFAFDFLFFSAEYPEWVGTEFNDTFNVIMTSTMFNGNIAFDNGGAPISINNTFFDICDGAGCTMPGSTLAGTGYDGGVGGATGWLTTIAPVAPGEQITLRFVIYDEGDGIYDSDVLIDNFRWELEPVEGPVTIQ